MRLLEAAKKGDADEVVRLLISVLEDVVFLHISRSKHGFSLSSAAAFRRAIAREENVTHENVTRRWLNISAPGCFSAKYNYFIYRKDNERAYKPSTRVTRKGDGAEGLVLEVGRDICKVKIISFLPVQKSQLRSNFSPSSPLNTL